MKKVLAFIKENITFILILAAIWLITTFVATGAKVDGSSMYPTFHDGDYLMTDRITYRFSDIKRFDVVIFDLNKGTNNGPYYLIKRVIGLPGDTVRIDSDGNIYINDSIIEESYGAERILDPGMAIEPIVLGENEYFVLGDNRNNSLDSRFEPVGIVSKDQILGEPFLQIFPFKKFGGI